VRTRGGKEVKTKVSTYRDNLKPPGNPLPVKPEPLQPITPVGDDSVIETLEKFLPYSDNASRNMAEAQLEAYKNRK